MKILRDRTGRKPLWKQIMFR